MSSKSSRYDTTWSTYLNHTHGRIIRYLVSNKLNQEISFLDVSSGTGSLHRRIYDESSVSVKKLHLNDPNTKMLSKGRKRFLRDAYGDKIDFSHQYAEDLRTDNRYEVILSESAYHLYQDKTHFFQAAKKQLAKDGRLLILDWNNESWFRPINSIISLRDNKQISTEGAATVVKRAREAGFTKIKCKRWRWRYWSFYLIVAKEPG